ncbi:hypothetical protein [Listeria goaensis]|nr:hypothetical protein [Listeria goaensis]
MEGRVLAKGSVYDVQFQLIWGIRSSMATVVSIFAKATHNDMQITKRST